MRYSFKPLGILLIGLLASVLLAGCAAKINPVEISDSDNGTVQELAVSQELRISLEANPTTGYQWALDGSMPKQLEQVGEPEYSADSMAVGSGGTEVWTFVAKEPGEAPLRLKYWRSFEPTVSPVSEFSIDVNVR